MYVATIYLFEGGLVVPKNLLQSLGELKRRCNEFDTLIANNGVLNLLKKAQYGELPTEEFIDICKAFVYYYEHKNES